MEADVAKQLVISAGKDLVTYGLIARTWGNVSCRIDDKTFAVTPSGRSYETLTKDEIVECSIEDASYEGEIKPSSEKGIHALIYRTYPEVNFVIHTHQPMASAISAAGIYSMPSDTFEALGDKVPVAGYGLPGTKKLRENIRKAISNSRGMAVIMAHHGALCYGKDYEETFAVAKQLEEACAGYIKNSYLKMSSMVAYDEKKYYNYYISAITGKEQNVSISPRMLYSSRRTPAGFILSAEKEAEYHFGDRMPEEALIHQMLYLKRKDINYISQDEDNSLYAISLSGVSLKPWLDDFAQIVGSSAECAKAVSPEAIVKALGNRRGVLVPGYGALCCAATDSDLQAVRLVMEKDAFAQIAALLLGGSKPIGLFDCKLMHFVYSKSYAKRSGNQGINN